MDGMLVHYHPVTTGGRGSIHFTETITLPRPTSVIAEISLALFDTASASHGVPVSAFALFTGCTTDGSNPPLPANETFAQGSLSGYPRSVVIRNGLTSLTYSIEVTNAWAHFVINVFFWPSVDRGRSGL